MYSPIIQKPLSPTEKSLSASIVKFSIFKKSTSAICKTIPAIKKSLSASHATQKIF